MFIPAGIAQLQRRHGAAPFEPTDISGCKLWLDASDRGVTANRWDDKSGNGNHFNAPASTNFPSFSGGIATFDGIDNYLNGPTNMMSGVTAGEIFLRQKRYLDAFQSGTNTGWMRFGTSGDIDHFIYTNAIYCGFGSNARKTCGDPSWSVADWHTLNIWSATNDWRMNHDGSSQYSTGTNAVAWQATPMLGHSGSGYYFQGDIKSVVVFNRKLNSTERGQMETYMAGL